jgi:hypothetical protein
MAADVRGHKFNDDLLLAEEDREWARTHFAGLYHALDHPELREIFARYDVPSKADKSRSRTLGLLAIGMLAVALLATTSAELWAAPHSTLSRAIEIASALLGLGGIAIGWSGALLGPRKHDWLRRRVMTERLRQLHFQVLARRLDRLARSVMHDDGRRVFEEERRGWLSAFTHEHEGKLESVYAALTAEPNEASLWLHPAAAADDQQLAALDKAGLFTAYRALRIQHQIHYADYQLRTSGPSPLSAVRNQHRVLEATWLVALLAIIALHLAAVLGALSGWFQPLHLLEGPAIHVASLWLLILGMSVRTVQAGLATSPEIERYLAYRTALLSIRDRFDAASTPRDRLHLMEETERLAFYEMLAFLRTHEEALFCL